MIGKMLWFNGEKGHGYIQTEDEERLYVASEGFLPEEEPKARCAGKYVTFERIAENGDTPAHAAERIEALAHAPERNV
jgi:cold shock CspA family protein